MQVTQEPLDQCQVALTIEVEENKVVHAVDQAYREYARYISVPGFRKGKAPMHFVRQRVSLTEVKHRTVELLVDTAYREALEETNITPYAQPNVEHIGLCGNPEIAEITLNNMVGKELSELKSGQTTVRADTIALLRSSMELQKHWIKDLFK
ncbi:MAG: trigger factor family protein [Capsulimonadaceae bacterium]